MDGGGGSGQLGPSQEPDAPLVAVPPAPMPSEERFMYLLKKNLSRRRANRLTDEELEELRRVREVLVEDQWNAYVDQAKELKRREKALPRKERERQEWLERQLVEQQKRRQTASYEAEKQRLVNTSQHRETPEEDTRRFKYIPREEDAVPVYKYTPRHDNSASSHRTTPLRVEDFSASTSPLEGERDRILQGMRRRLQDAELEQRAQKKKMEEERERHSSEMERSRREIAAMQSQMEQMTLSMQEESSTLREHLTETQQLYDAEKRANAGETDKGQMSDVPTDLRQAQQRIQQLEGRVMTLLRAQETLAATHSIQEESLRKSRAQLEKSLKIESSRVKELERELVETRESLSDLRGNHEKEVGKLQQQLLKRLADGMVSEGVEKSDEEILALREENAKLREEVVSLRSEVAESGTVKGPKEEEAKRMVEEVNAVKAEDRQLQKLRTDLTSRIVQCKRVSQSVKKDTDELRSSVSYLLSEFRAEISSFVVELARCWADLLETSDSAFENAAQFSKPLSSPSIKQRHFEQTASHPRKSVESPRLSASSSKVSKSTPEVVDEMKSPSPMPSPTRREVQMSPRGVASLGANAQMRVYVRMRPVAYGTKLCVKMKNDFSVEIFSGPECRVVGVDGVYSTRCSQSDVAEDVLDLVEQVVEGKNVCIIAFGETNSGKTFTIDGSASEPGLSSRLVAELFNILDALQETHSYEIRMDAIDVKGDTFVRVLSSEDEKKRGVIVSDAEVYERMKSLARANRFQSKGKSKMRRGKIQLQDPSTHYIHVLRVTLWEKASRRSVTSHLTFFETAGSEVVSHPVPSEKGSVAVSPSAREMMATRKGFIALNDVLIAIANNHTHVPYRNSKLTSFLQDSLGPNCFVVLNVHVNPSMSNYTETSNCLSFATRIKSLFSSSEDMVAYSPRYSMGIEWSKDTNDDEVIALQPTEEPNRVRVDLSTDLAGSGSGQHWKF